MSGSCGRCGHLATHAPEASVEYAIPGRCTGCADCQHELEAETTADREGEDFDLAWPFEPDD